MTFTCGTCRKAFPAGWKAREQHLIATEHKRPAFECDSCDAYFASYRAKQEHMSSKNHFIFKCRVCSVTLPTEDAVLKHEVTHEVIEHEEIDQYSCRGCDYLFDSEELRQDHEAEEHWYCGDCDLHFESYSNVKMHLFSRAHRGKPILCPLCFETFTTVAGAIHHLERGACPRAGGLNREQIYKIVRGSDPSSVITKKMLEWRGAEEEYEATERTWNGSSYECYICHRQFGKLESLNQHLNSATHQQSIYHCPKCRREVATLAALVNHLESETCGYMRFNTVQTRFQALVSGNRLLSV